MLLYFPWVLLPTFCFLCGLVAFCLSGQRILNTLLSLEFLMLNLFWLGISLFLYSEVMFLLFFLTMAACEGALGLSVLVSMVRSHGNDSLGGVSILKC